MDFRQGIYFRRMQHQTAMSLIHPKLDKRAMAIQVLQKTIPSFHSVDIIMESVSQFVKNKAPQITHMFQHNMPPIPRAKFYYSNKMHLLILLASKNIGVRYSILEFESSEYAEYEIWYFGLEYSKNGNNSCRWMWQNRKCLSNIEDRKNVNLELKWRRGDEMDRVFADVEGSISITYREYVIVADGDMNFSAECYPIPTFEQEAPKWTFFDEIDGLGLRGLSLVIFNGRLLQC